MRSYAQLQWIPLPFREIHGDPRYSALKNFQQGWFWNLVLETLISVQPGYVRDDEQLWRLARAIDRANFEQFNTPVRAMFESERFGESTWLYHPRILGIMKEQTEKLIHKKRRFPDISTEIGKQSYLDFEVGVKKISNMQECTLHPNSGRTQWGTCWGCYVAK